MASAPGWLTTDRDHDRLLIAAGGVWSIASIAALDERLGRLEGGTARTARLDLEKLESLDTAGAWVLHRTLRRLRDDGLDVELAGVRPAHRALLERVAAGDVAHELERERLNPFMAMVEQVGRGAMDAAREAASLLSFLGETTITALYSVAHPGRIRVVALFSHLERTGLNALPIIGLLSFLIGVVVAYQGADQLRRFGAEIFTVNLLGVSILREMGILLTAIVIAGRSGSAFAAQIGTMQVNQEIDAMRALGLDPVEILVLPRMFALVIALPLLAIFADVMGLAGGALMSYLVLDISLVQFLERLKNVVPIWNFWIGIIKAPVFGYLIGLVGCREGLMVSGSAESVGRQTTRAVVVSIFLVIVADAVFSIIFSVLGI
jgi:phospholipid/cholesterol/gamma-HCH transport system permease protein